MTAYQFAILRYRNSISSGELVNVGIVMWVPSTRQVHHKLNNRYTRLKSFFPDLDGPAYRNMIRRLNRRFNEVEGEQNSPSLFPRNLQVLEQVLPLLLIPTDSCFQWSDSMGGLVQNVERRLDELYGEFVTKHDERRSRERRDEDSIWADLVVKFHDSKLDKHIDYDVVIVGSNYKYTFKAGWMNGTQQVIEPVSLDLSLSASIIDKANTWSGRLYNLRAASNFKLTSIVSRPSDPNLIPAFEQGIKILEKAPSMRRVVIEDNLDVALRMIKTDVSANDEP